LTSSLGTLRQAVVATVGTGFGLNDKLGMVVGSLGAEWKSRDESAKGNQRIIGVAQGDAEMVGGPEDLMRRDAQHPILVTRVVSLEQSRVDELVSLGVRNPREP
jgi:hypothetical protein